VSIHQTLFVNYSNPLRVVDAADFDGTNDYLSRGSDLTGAADSKTGIFSCWVRIDGGNGTDMYILDNATSLGAFRFFVRRRSTHAIEIYGYNSAGVGIMDLGTFNTTYSSSSTWLHILASWDLGAGTYTLRISDTADTAITTFTNDSIDHTTGAFYVGASPVGGSGGKFNGAIAELYFAPGQYLDCDLVYNRRKFISASGKPVHLGSDGSLPTGTAPLLYLHLDDAEAAANFATNRGTGGNLSVTGSLDTASSSPSD